MLTNQWNNPNFVSNISSRRSSGSSGGGSGGNGGSGGSGFWYAKLSLILENYLHDHFTFNLLKLNVASRSPTEKNHKYSININTINK